MRRIYPQATDELISLVKSSGAQGLVTVALAEDADLGHLAPDDVRSPIKSHVSIDVIAEIARLTGAGAGDLVLIVAGPTKTVNAALSNLRNEMGRRLNLADPDDFKYAFITDFPLFEHDDETGQWVPEHHVFSAPQPGHEDFLETDPGKVHGQLFDLVCNGSELGSGSIRIHDRGVQERVFNVIGYSTEEVDVRFGHLLKAFEYGAPPHGGMGLRARQAGGCPGRRGIDTGSDLFPKDPDGSRPALRRARSHIRRATGRTPHPARGLKVFVRVPRVWRPISTRRRPGLRDTI